MGDFMLGRRGLVHSPWDVTEDDFDLDFIATSLSRQGRYLGNGRHYLSVAEHCIELSRVVHPSNAFCALMHDATEAFVGDLHSWIKLSMRDEGESVFDDLEDHFWELIATKYDLPRFLPDDVEEQDLRIREREMNSLFGDGTQPFAGLMPYQAHYEFMRRAKQLRPGIR